MRRRGKIQATQRHSLGESWVMRVIKVVTALVRYLVIRFIRAF